MCGLKCVKNAHVTGGGVFASKYVEREPVCVSAHDLFAWLMMNEMQERTAK